jgi:hypothetical protein
LETLFELAFFGTGWRYTRGGEAGDQGIIRAHAHGVGPFVIGLPAGLEVNDLPGLVSFLDATPRSSRGVVIVATVAAARSHRQGCLSWLGEGAGPRVWPTSSAWRCAYIFQCAVRTVVLPVLVCNFRTARRGRQVSVAKGSGHGSSSDDGLELHFFVRSIGTCCGGGKCDCEGGCSGNNWSFENKGSFRSAIV